MAREIILYGTIWDETAVDFIKQIESATGKDITIRISCVGGDAQQTFGMVAKLKEHEGKVTIKVDGKAYSAAAYFLCYADSVTCLDVSEFVFHRAAYSIYYEPTESDLVQLDKINGYLRTALENKINVATFEKITGVTLDELFSNDGRVNVTLDAKQAKKVGLVNKIVKINSEINKEINSLIAMHSSKMVALVSLKDNKDNKEINKNLKLLDMNINSIKNENLELYNEIFNLGVRQEKDRVLAFCEFFEVDSKKVIKSIEEDAKMNSVMLAYFTKKIAQNSSLKILENGNIEDINTGEAKKFSEEEAQKLESTEKGKQKKVAEFEVTEKKLNNILGLKIKQ